MGGKERKKKKKKVIYAARLQKRWLQRCGGEACKLQTDWEPRRDAAVSALHVVRTVVVASFSGLKTRAILFFFFFWSSEDTGAVVNAMIYLLDAPMPGNRRGQTNKGDLTTSFVV